MIDEGIKNKAKSGDANACYEIGISYLNGDGVRKNKNKAFDYLWTSAEGNNVSAMACIADIYVHERKLSQEIDEGKASQLNSWACILFLDEIHPEYKNKAYILFRVCSTYSIDAAASLAYCKFKGIAVKKNYKEAFEILYNNKLEGTIQVLKSSKTNGIEFTPPKSSVQKNVRIRHKKQNLWNSIKAILRIPLHFLYWPYLSIVKGMIEYDTQVSESDKSPGEGGIELLSVVIECFLYLVFVNAVIDVCLWWAFDISGFLPVLIVFFISVIASLIYIKLSSEQIEEILNNAKLAKRNGRTR